MSDVEEIRRLLAGYASTFDARDPEGFANLFTEDGIMQLSEDRQIVGRDKLTKAVERMPPSEGRHYPEAPEVSVDADTATATSRFRALTGTGAEVTGTYHDQLRRTPDGWRIAHRRILED
jgi:uncharacterized protein (TIGR02246 family)